MQRKRRIRKKKSNLILFLIIYIIDLSFIFSSNSSETQAMSVAEGLAKLKEMENSDKSQIESLIYEAEKLDDEQRKMENLKEKNKSKGAEEKKQRIADLKKKFEYSIVIGDSITTGLIDYNMLESQSVAAKRGLGASQLEEEIKTAVAMIPKNLFFSIGLNDLGYYNGKSDRFIKAYKEKLLELKNNYPDISIYVNGILPVQQSTIDENPVYEKINEYNEKIQKMCDELNITFIDNSILIKDIKDIYQADGIHMKPVYYPMWLEHMAEKAGL